MGVRDFDWNQLPSPLLSWYEENKRILPWRSEPTPYHVWISEIMLQQTRVDAVKPYYHRFLSTLPTIKDLATAPEDTYLKLWEGLGYYSRVRNLHKAAVLIEKEHEGKVPGDKSQLLALPGIGSYTAGAILSIAYGKREPAVDGNVLRILSRVSADNTDILLPEAKRNAEKTLENMMASAGEDFAPGAFNQALMDLGAMVCIPNGTPHCEVCPLSTICMARKDGMTEVLPIRIKKTKRRIEERTVLLLQAGDKYAISKRPEDGLLAGLYEFPNTLGYLSKEEMTEWVMKMGFVPYETIEEGEGKHIFSHVEWRMKGYRVLLHSTEQTLGNTDNLVFLTKEELEKSYTLPSAFRFLSTKLV